MASERTRNAETEWGYSSDTTRAMANVSGDREITVWLPDSLAEEIEAEVGAGRYCSVPEAIEDAIAQFVDGEGGRGGGDE